MKTICVPERLHKEIITLKLEERQRNTAELIEQLVINYKKQKLFEASKLFRKSMKRKGMDFVDLLKKSKEMRKQIANEWF